ncbi:MAG: hypothetical protein ACXV7F_10010 [Methylomonas sp.]
MMHIRRAILEALRTQLKTLPVFAGVWIQRIGPTRNSYPSITLYADAEPVEYLTLHQLPRKQERTLAVSVNVWVRGTANDEKAESDMDAFAVSIESVLAKPSQAADMVLVATDFKVAEEEPEIHVITLTYSVSYFSTEFSPTV